MTKILTQHLCPGCWTGSRPLLRTPVVTIAQNLSAVAHYREAILQYYTDNNFGTLPQQAVEK